MSNQDSKTTNTTPTTVGNPSSVIPGNSYNFVFHRPTLLVEVVEAEDTLFRSDSAVFLPTAIPDKTDEDEPDSSGDPSSGGALNKQKKISGLSVMSGVFRFLQRCIHEGKPKRILITGHTDSVGSDEYNQELSKLRAEVIWALLLGGPFYRSIFVKHVNNNHANEDIQHILKWIAYPQAQASADGGGMVWNDVDPGKVDGKIGPNTQSAIRNFKKRMRSDVDIDTRYKGVVFSSDFGDIRSTLVNNPDFKANSWAAVFEIYQAEIHLALKHDSLDLSDIRGRLAGNKDDEGSTPMSDLWPLDAVGCGETWPIEARGTDNYCSQTNRRVEILFYDPVEFHQKLPCKDDACAEEDCHVFKNLDRYEEDKKEFKPKLEWKYLPLAPEGEYELIIVIDSKDTDSEEEFYHLWSDDNTFSKSLRQADGVPGDNGSILLSFADIPPYEDRKYSLSQHSSDGDFVGLIFSEISFREIFYSSQNSKNRSRKNPI